jgi:hypothetical protein|tara:strand:- start:4876 stop:5034 length:159 start_codon:yes stop_codon:yes gene_type:complete
MLGTERVEACEYLGMCVLPHIVHVLVGMESGAGDNTNPRSRGGDVEITNVEA